MPELPPAYWTTSEITERFRCTKRTIDRWIKREINPFPKAKISHSGTDNLWSIREVEEWENSL